MKSRLGATVLFSAGLLGGILLVSGCASAYVTPAGPARLTMFADEDISSIMKRQAAISLPASFSLVRVQAPNRYSYSRDIDRNTRYLVVTPSDVEEAGDLDLLAKWPMVEQAVHLNRLLLDGELEGDRPIRQAAARLRADVILLYTLDTRVGTDEKLPYFEPVTLGLLNAEELTIHAVASALLLDVRTGAVLGAVEGASQESYLTNNWTRREDLEQVQGIAERKAFEEMLEDAGQLWSSVVESIPPGGGAPVAAIS